jgi:hypothetical protein
VGRRALAATRLPAAHRNIKDTDTMNFITDNHHRVTPRRGYRLMCERLSILAIADWRRVTAST